MKAMLLVVLGMFIVASSYAEINFLRGQLADAVKKAETDKKPIMIDFITDWCRWCDTLDARTYSDANVAGYVNQHLVAIKIDAEKGEGIDIAKKYGVAAYPTIVFIKTNGEEIDRILGYVKADPFLKTVTDYVNGVNTLGALLEQLKTNPADAKLHYTLATKYDERNDAKVSAGHFSKILELDPTNSLGHNEEAEYAVAMAAFRESKDPSRVEAFVAKYPKSDMVRNAFYQLWRTYAKAKDEENARKFFAKSMEMNPTDLPLMNSYAWLCQENGINLDEASNVAKKATELATKDGDKASYMDTYAMVEFVRGNVDRALELEQQAIEMVKKIPGAKTTEYEKTLAKIKAGKKTTGTQ
ncbi:MAG: thiol:disulfide interchange protein [Bacteroidetes bacterium]|nr:thiol:disulfide interchange protein [Bacteroidota bacterium]